MPSTAFGSEGCVKKDLKLSAAALCHIVLFHTASEADTHTHTHITNMFCYRRVASYEPPPGPLPS